MRQTAVSTHLNENLFEHIIISNFTLSANSQTSKIEKLLIKNGDTISFQKLDLIVIVKSLFLKIKNLLKLTFQLAVILVMKASQNNILESMN